jgi:hypothetical protein
VDHDWDGWPEDGYGEHTGDTADLGGSDDSLSNGGLDAYGDPGGSDDAFGGHDAGGFGGHDADGFGGHDADGAQPPAGGEGYLEDDPMGAFHADAGDPGDGPDAADQGHGDVHSDDGQLDDSRLEDAPPAGELETVVGADPDVDPTADWSPPQFPEHLDVVGPEPVDGYPWSDANVVAAPGTGGGDPAYGPDAAPQAAELLDYASADGGADPWSALVGSDDPATSSLGRWWAPGG